MSHLIADMFLHQAREGGKRQMLPSLRVASQIS